MTRTDWLITDSILSHLLTLYNNLPIHIITHTLFPVFILVSVKVGNRANIMKNTLLVLGGLALGAFMIWRSDVAGMNALASVEGCTPIPELQTYDCHEE